ncbi:LppA family lipoprotein [Mycoplasma capricolum subsp. capricolum]|uniref:LppA family lipoprotein n=1 Tax=Mycoplasma capricolum TaxID=2095 RepID=UPI003DA679B7
MKRTTKLLLSILPISSISLLSLVSCSTTSSNNKKPEENRTDKPNNSNETNDNNNNQNDPNNKTEADPKQPNSANPNEPSNSINPEKEPNTQPRKPDNRPQDDQPQNEKPHDESQNHKVDFSDLNKFHNEISFTNFEFYKNRDPRTAWDDLLKDQNLSFKNYIFYKDQDILNKYEINFESSIHDVIFNLEKGVIENIKIKFTKNKEFKIILFTFTGFKKTTNETFNRTNNKENYVKQKQTTPDHIKGLFPSLVAYMTLYTQEPKDYENLMITGNVINFEELQNRNPDLFVDRNLILNHTVIKNLLLDYNKELGKLYTDKIKAVRYDDVNGVLALKIEITNRDDNNKTSNEPSITKEFIFNGFRKVDFNNQDKNALSLTLLQKDLKELIKKGILKKKINELKLKNENMKKISIEDKESSFLKNDLFKKIIVNVNDDIYNSTQTLSLYTNTKMDGNKSILGMANNMSIYPFHTLLTKDSIKNIFLTLTNEEDSFKAKIDFDFEVPIFSSTFSDLTSHAVSADEQKIILKISSETFLD